MTDSRTSASCTPQKRKLSVSPMPKRKASTQHLVQPTKKSKSTDLYAESFLLGVEAFDKEKRSQNNGRKMALSKDPKITAALIAYHHTRLRPLAALSHPQIAAHLSATVIRFELVTSDIIIRKPFLTADAVHIYIPSVAVGLAIERLEMATKRMGKGGTYSVDSVLNLLGEKCACGSFHWEGMGWSSGEGTYWPMELGVNKAGVRATVVQLRAHLSEARVPKVWLDGKTVGFAASRKGGKAAEKA